MGLRGTSTSRSRRVFWVVMVCVFSSSAFGQYATSPEKTFVVVRKDPNAAVNTKDDNLSSEGKLFFNGSSWVFSWTPTYDDAGTYEVTFISTNGWAEDFETITITVNDVSGLVGHWTMDDNAANTTVVDSSGNGNDGTAQQYTRDLSSTGRINGALNFNGTDDYIDCGSDSGLDITGSVSISTWVKFDSLADYRYQTIVAKRDTGIDIGANYALRKGGYANGDELQFYYHDGTAWHVYTTFNANLTWGQWYHVVVTFTFGTGKSIKCHLNNNLLKGGWTTGDGNSSVQTNTKPVTIGGLTTGQGVDGSIDNVMIFDKVLSEAEIGDLYNEGAGLKVNLAIDNLWMYQNLPGQVSSALTASVSVVDDPMGNNGYSYEWEILLPRDVSLAPTTVAGGGTSDAYWSLAARGSDEPAGLSDLGDTFTVRVTVTGDDYGDVGIAEAEFEIISITNLVGHWKMDDNAANTTVVDSSGNGNDGTAQQYTRDLSSTGRINGALNFNGTDDYIDCGSDSGLDITGSVSISTWVKFDSLADYRYQTIVAKRDTGIDIGANYALRKGGYANGDELQFYYHDGTAWHVYTTFNANLTWGQWYHVVVTFTFGTGKSIKCHLNNNLLKGGWTTGDGNSSVQTNTKPVTIGGLTTGQGVDGSIDNVMIFDKVLSEAEIGDLYNEGAGLKVNLAIDNLWMYQNLPGQVASALTASVSIIDDPLGNSSYSYEWEILLPRDVSLAPTTVSGGGTSDAYWTFAARGSDEPAGLSDLGDTFTVRVTVTGDDYGDVGIAEADFGIALLGDVNNDGAVNSVDLSIVNAFWQTGSGGPHTVRDCDLNCDGAVNLADHFITKAAIWQGMLGQNSVSSPCPLR